MEIIKIKSRYGNEHSLIPIDEKHYRFKSAEEWMPIRLIGMENNYKALDPEGGPFMTIGFEIEGKKINKISETDNGIIIEFE